MSTMQITGETVRRLVTRPNQIDSNLPLWARRTNPVVKRHLGIYWRVFMPDLEILLRGLLIQAIILALTAVFTYLYIPILMMVLTSMVLLPVAFYFYVEIIANVITDSVTSMTLELNDETLMLLRVTPLSMQNILLSKAAAAFWRQIEELDTVLIMALYLGTPMIAMLQVSHWPPDAYPYVSEFMTIALMVTALLRLPLEMFMIAMLSMTVSVTARLRNPAMIASGVLAFFYFLLINLPRLAHLSLGMQIVVEIVVPLVLPIILTLGALRVMVYILTRD